MGCSPRGIGELRVVAHLFLGDDFLSFYRMGRWSHEVGRSGSCVHLESIYA